MKNYHDDRKLYLFYKYTFPNSSCKEISNKFKVGYNYVKKITKSNKNAAKNLKGKKP